MRNTICATLTAITLTLCTALAGCGSASEPSTPAHAVRSVDSQCSAGADVFTECVITLTDTRQDELQRRHHGRHQNVREHRRCRRLRAGHVPEDWRAGQGIPCRDRLVAFTVRPTTKDTK